MTSKKSCRKTVFCLRLLWIGFAKRSWDRKGTANVPLRRFSATWSGKSSLTMHRLDQTQWCEPPVTQKETGEILGCRDWKRQSNKLSIYGKTSNRARRVSSALRQIAIALRVQNCFRNGDLLKTTIFTGTTLSRSNKSAKWPPCPRFELKQSLKLRPFKHI